MKYIIIICLLFLFSCSKSNDSNGTTNNNNDADSIPAAYIGVWKGTYTYGGGGTWTVKIYKDGKVDGSMSHNQTTRYGDGYALGTLNKTGDIRFHQAAPVSGPWLVGKLNGTTASGTTEGYGVVGWEPWEGTKQ